MSRYIRDIVLNQPEDFVEYMMNDYLTKEGFKLVNFKGEQVYRSGGGIFEMPKMIIWNYQNGVFHLEAWTRACWLPGVYGKESDMSGFVGALPKQKFRDSIMELERLLQQPLPEYAHNPSQGTNMDSENGTQNPGMNGSVPNQGTVYVQGVDTGRYAGFALGFSLAGLAGLISPLIGVIFASVGIVYGKKALNGSKRGMAIAAMVIGIITMILSILNWILAMVLMVNRL